MKILNDVTDKYYQMLNSFRADNTLKINEIKHNEIAFGKSYFEVEKDLIKTENERLMNDVELLEELEFNIRHNKIKIVEIVEEGESDEE